MQIHRTLPALAAALLLLTVSGGCSQSIAEPMAQKSRVEDLRKGGEEAKVDTTAETGPALEGWATLTGKFVLDSAAPTPATIEVTKDQQACSKERLVDETLVVGQGGGIANIALWMRPDRNQKPKIHPDYESSARPEVLIDNKNCRFAPHIVTVWVGKEKLTVGNSDPVAHNSNLQTQKNEPINPLISPASSIGYEFKTEETAPTAVSCNIHPWMKGFVLARNLPYMAITDDTGKFTIKNIPLGKWTFQVWHEAAKGGLAAQPDWKQGRVVVDLKTDGETKDLGEIKVAASLLQ